MHSILKANIPGSSCISAAAAAVAVTIVIVVACYCCSGLLFISVLYFSRGAPYMHRKTQIDENIHWLISPDSCFGAILHVCGILVCTWYYQFDGHSMYKTRLKKWLKTLFLFSFTETSTTRSKSFGAAILSNKKCVRMNFF